MASKSFDLTKFRKSLTKSIEGLGIGFNDPDTWISTGSYALNYLISSDFKKGIPLGKVTVVAGESGCLTGTATVNIRATTHKSTLTDYIYYDIDNMDISVERLKDLYFSYNYKIEILTPDGYQKIGSWYDKGILPTKSISTNSFTTTCANNHLIQLCNDKWMMADDLAVGDVIQTIYGYETIIKIEDSGNLECFDFEILHPNHRYWGDGMSSHNSGKSYVCSGNIIKNAQEQDIFVILIDSENALDESWLKALGVDTSPDKLLKLNMAMIDDVAKTISDFMKEYKEMTDVPKILFVVDSLGMLLTPTDVKQLEDGDLKGDMGRKPKALTALVRNCVNMFGTYNVGLVATNHTYSSQNIFDPDDKISGGQGFIYASSIVIGMQKFKLKEDMDGIKTSTVNGIRSKCKIMKSRYAKPFEEVEIKIPFDVGMDPHSGLFDLFLKKKLLNREGNSYIYVDVNGQIHKYFEKAWNRNTNGVLDLIMTEFEDKLKLMKLEEKENDIVGENDDDVK